MGFHRRYITNDLIKSMYTQRGIKSVKSLVDKVDAFIVQDGLAQDFIDLANYQEDINDVDRWNIIDKLIRDNIYTKEMNVFDLSVNRIEVYKILYNSEYSRDRKLMELKLYLTQFKDELDANGFEYTRLASQFVKEYYDTQRTSNKG